MTISPLRATLSRRTLIAGTTATLAATATSRTGSGHTAHQATPAASPIAQPDMRGAIHAFQIGDFSCHAISDGASISPETVGLLFAGSSPEDVEEAITATGVDLSTMVSHHTPVMVDTGDQLVLIDTGFGPGFTPTDGFLLENLQQHGTAPEDIDVVIITHGHPDHIGANADADGNPTFPNARYVITQTDWDFWTDDAQVEEAVPVPDFRELLLSFAHRHLTPLEAQFDLIDYGDEIVPGITSIAAPGHTPGHMVVLVESADVRLWIGGDAAITPINLPFPNWWACRTSIRSRCTKRASRFSRGWRRMGVGAALHRYGNASAIAEQIPKSRHQRHVPITTKSMSTQPGSTTTTGTGMSFSSEKIAFQAIGNANSLALAHIARATD